MFDPKLFEGFLTKEEVEAIPVMHHWADNDSIIYNMNAWLHIQKLMVQKFKEFGASMFDKLEGKGLNIVRVWAVTVAPTIVVGVAQAKYPTAFNEDMDPYRVRDISFLLFAAENHLLDMKELPHPDVFDDIEYTVESRAHFMGKEWMSDWEMKMKLEVYINNQLLHPRHYRYNKLHNEVIFMDPRIIANGAKVRTVAHKTASDFEFHVSKTRGEDWGKMVKEFELHPRQNDIHHKTQTKPRLASTGMALCSDMEGWGVQYRAEQPEDLPETVKGNGRQVIIDNGKHKWPAPKQRKGHRKHG